MTDTESTSGGLARVTAERDALQVDLLHVLTNAHWACVKCGYHNLGQVCTHCGQALVPAKEQTP